MVCYNPKKKKKKKGGGDGAMRLGSEVVRYYKIKDEGFFLFRMDGWGEGKAENLSAYDL